MIGGYIEEFEIADEDIVDTEKGTPKQTPSAGANAKRDRVDNRGPRSGPPRSGPQRSGPPRPNRQGPPPVSSSAAPRGRNADASPADETDGETVPAGDRDEMESRPEGVEGEPVPAKRRRRGRRGGRGRRRNPAANAGETTGEGPADAPKALDGPRATVASDLTPTGSADRHLVNDEPIAPPEIYRPRTSRDLDSIPDDFD